MGARGFDYDSPAAIAKEIRAAGARLQTTRGTAPPAASDPSARRTHFRGHLLEEKVCGLRELVARAPAAAAAAVGG
jgi:hypothetical protein